MEAATLTLSSTLQIYSFRLFTCTGHKPTITMNPRNRTMTLFPHGHLQVIMCGQKSCHVAHAAVRAGLEMNGDDHDGKRTRVVVGPAVVLACVLGTMCLTLPMCRPSLANAWPLFPWSALEEKEVTPAKPGSTQEENEVTRVKPDSTLEALMNMEKAKTIELTEEVKFAQKFLETNSAFGAQDMHLASRINLDDLQKAARNLASSGKTDAAVVKLKSTYQILKKKNMPQEAYNFGLVLVELLIYQGKYDEANKLVEEVEKLLPSSLNADPKLYKAVIQLMSGKVEDAKSSWKDYVKSTDQYPKEGGKQVDFQEFREHIKKLKKN